DRLWDGVSTQTQSGQAITISGEKIVGVGALDRAGGADVRTYSGCTILPGLIDAHVHYCSWMGNLFLAAGVTTVRDVGNDLAWILNRRRMHGDDASLGPAIVCCGKAL